ncbi:MAG: L-lysine 6-monooxygenase [Pseudonocardia sp. SCN 72-86]|nr:MAG: L-lysine 6-monooxygenase [Pseudonocardia sp. SCN 72-86]
MAMSTCAPSGPAGAGDVLDVLGVGFGPSNLGLAIALAEHNDAAGAGGRRLSARFLERQPRFGWHRGMLIDDATMRISYLKDLVTLRNPTSPFSFLSYLHDRGRLVDFINYGSSMPSRLEFHDYLEWAASSFASQVDYGCEVVAVEPEVGADGTVEVLTVVVRSAAGEVRHRARNVVVATGLTPLLPPRVAAGERIWHSRDLLHRAPAAAGTAPERVAVVGAGQSAAEVADFLHRTFPAAEVCAIFSRYGYSPADDSPFANRIFDPGAVDDFFDATDDAKQRILGYHANTNYSVVDPELITDLYRRHYHERVAGTERLRILNLTRVGDVVETEDRVELALESVVDGSRDVVSVDLVVFATGYRSSDPLRLLPALAGTCRRDPAGRLRIGRDYRVETDPELRAGVYVQGATEHSHGISSTLLSNVAVRAGEIVASIATPAAIATAPVDGNRADLAELRGAR